MSHADRPDPESITLNNGNPAATTEQLLAAIEALDIEHQTITHEALYTVEQSRQVQFELPGAHTKNLFLRNKKGRMFLFVVEQDQMIDLKGLREQLQLPGGQFAFASTERLGKYLGVVPGSVSPLALFNDHDQQVSVYIQDNLLEHNHIYIHPCRNTHSTRIKTADLVRLLEAWDHPVTVLSF